AEEEGVSGLADVAIHTTATSGSEKSTPQQPAQRAAKAGCASDVAMGRTEKPNHQPLILLGGGLKVREHGVAESRDHGNVGPAQPFQMNLIARARKLEGIACRPRKSHRGWRYRE